MATSSDDIYKQIISMQSAMYDSHSEIKDEIEALKVAIHNRVAPIEAQVAKHQHTFEITTKVLTWALPSGMFLSLAGWLTSMFGGVHKP
jgi:hypothetical protein